MSIALLVAIGSLTSVGLYLITSRSLSRIILGFSLLGHASVLALLTAGGPPGDAPIADTAGSDVSNPIPQALALTAIVISFGLTLFLLALAGRQQDLSGDDQVEDDIEDRRIAGRISAKEAAEHAEEEELDSELNSESDSEVNSEVDSESDPPVSGTSHGLEVTDR